jgi:DNA-3-methyladenine glycosylase II
MGAFTLEPRGPFTLSSAARFIAGWPPSQGDVDDDHVRLTFLVDDWSGPASVVMYQHDSVVKGTVEADNEERAIAQAARIVSLDHDGTGYVEVGERDPVVGELQKSSGYLRPVLFHSPYEAAAWSIISARTRQEQAVKIRDALSRGGIFPAPKRLLALRAQLALPEGKLTRLHTVAEAALEGKLDREPLLAADPGEALAQLQELPGIGPFYAALILLRAVGTTDVLATGEPQLKKAVEKRYGKPLEDVAEQWRPFRTWVSVLMRAHA